ncbi:hypothetical protein [Sulfobacillus thermosulfidooxidans]|uniref:hypothetical protein n=1 Tax=Sulfobacillus thermosulfidooxidans TaxID=28034 RepID=UPI0006B5D92B|nr:hypothetical protein [Sulfobacillus thermosulfidooxidans]
MVDADVRRFLAILNIVVSAVARPRWRGDVCQTEDRELLPTPYPVGALRCRIHEWVYELLASDRQNDDGGEILRIIRPR